VQPWRKRTGGKKRERSLVKQLYSRLKAIEKIFEAPAERTETRFCSLKTKRGKKEKKTTTPNRRTGKKRICWKLSHGKHWRAYGLVHITRKLDAWGQQFGRKGAKGDVLQNEGKGAGNLLGHTHNRQGVGGGEKWTQRIYTHSDRDVFLGSGRNKKEEEPTKKKGVRKDSLSKKPGVNRD